MRSRIFAVLLAVTAIAPVITIVYYMSNIQHQQSVEFDVKPLQAGVTFDVKACKVLDGFRYEMYLEGGKWIEAHLRVATKDAANEIVVDLLKTKTSLPTTVTLLKQVGNYWIVDFQIDVDGKVINMVDLLKDKELLL
jgi:hypothetical protein